jgi:transposase
MKVCGLDVHKDSVFCAIYNGKVYSEVKKYETLTNQVYAMGHNLQSGGVTRVAMESTGIYWIPIWNILEEMGFELMLVNPYLIRQMPGRKSDVKDAQWIAKLLYKGMLRGSLVPDARIRDLRTYSRKYVKLQYQLTSVLQTMERTLEMCSIRITSFVSNISGKSVISVIEALITGERDVGKMEGLVHGRIRNRHKGKIREALTGFVSEHHRFQLELLKEEYDLLMRHSRRCLERMEHICVQQYLQELDLLMSMPGISTLAAMLIIAETGADMRAFATSSKFTGWTGLRPRNDESAGKYKSRAITKGNRYLRAVLVQAAWGAVKAKNSYFKEKFNRLALRISRKKALIAIARKLNVIIWHLLSEKRPYDPGLLPVYDPVRLASRMRYHIREKERLEKLICQPG